MIRRVSRTRVSYVVQEDYSEYNTQHHAPVQALALDDVSAGPSGSRGGILYSGGRDGAVNSWDCNLALEYTPPAPPAAAAKPGSRVPSVSFTPRGHRYTLSSSSSQLQAFRQGHARGSSTGADVAPTIAFPADLSRTGSDALEPPSSEARPLQARTGKPPQLQSPVSNRAFSISSANAISIPGIALETRRRRYTPEKTTHRTSYLGHSDWVNDVVLVDGNRSLVSGSSDRTLLLWPCHSPSFPNPDPTWTPTPSAIGCHSDYVRTICYSQQQNWIASGGLDRRICIWDLGEGRKDPLKSMWGVPLPSEAASAIFTDQPAHSIYTLATPPSGSILVSGSPERVVRVWDPRSPNTRHVLKLNGHTDNVRSVLVSADGKWVLSASSDATVKLWSLAQPARCAVTYTHFSDSVWTLYSSHPDLETFWTGGKDGMVCKVNRNPPGRGLDSEVEEVGDVVVVCREKGGINKIVAIDDLYVFTAVTNSSSIHRWKDVPLRSAEPAFIATAGLVSSPSSETPLLTPASPSIPPPASTSSTPQLVVPGTTSSAPLAGDASELWEPVPIPVLAVLRPASSSLALASFMPAVDALSYRAGSSGRGFRANSMSGTAPDGTLSEALLEGDAKSALVFEADSDSDDEAGSEPVWKEPEETILGKVGIVNIFLCNDKRRVISEDADGVVSMWDIVRCKKIRSWHPEASPSAPSKTASQSVFLSEDTGIKSKNPLFQQVVAQENTFDFAGTWCSLDNKTGAITVHLEENRCFDAEAYWDELVPPPVPESKEETRVNIGKWVLAYVFQNFRHGCLFPNLPRPVQPRLPTSLAIDFAEDDQSEASGAGGSTTFDGSSVASFNVAPSEGALTAARSASEAQTNGGTTAMPTSIFPQQKPAVASGSKAGGSPSPSALAVDVSESVAVQQSQGAAGPSGSAQSPHSPHGSFMDRLKLHMRRRTTSTQDKDGRSSKRSSKVPTDGVPSDQSQDGSVETPAEPQHPSDVNYRDTPPLELPPDVPVIVSVEESNEASSFLDLYRGTICSMGNLDEVERLKQVIPTWVYEFTVEGKANVKEAQKMSFQLFAYPDCGLPELPSGNNRLSANRMLRIRKLLSYIVEKLDLDPLNPRSIASKFVPVSERVQGMKPEAWLELWLGDRPLSARTTLATVRNFFWKQGGQDVILHYRPIKR
ncbi:hypothetical protein DFJ74DRAFT_690074 [Hyaloraphidium curvatum]|nr:hypothetical protein DFJ74DRAFT_690074 [Hyaloraphidium curvatum]